MLERLYEDATSFGFPEERFERVYAGGRGHALPRRRARACGRAAARAWMEIDRAWSWATACRSCAATPSTPPTRPSSPRTATGTPALLCVLERDAPADDPIPASEARGPLRAPWSPRCGCGRPAAWRSGRRAGASPTRAAGSRSRSARAARRASSGWLLGRGRGAGLPRVLRGDRRRSPGRDGRLGARALRDGLRAAVGGPGAVRLPARPAGAARRHERRRPGQHGAAAGGAVRRGGRARATCSIASRPRWRWSAS